MQKSAWLVQGFDGLKPLFRWQVSSALSEAEIRTLLRNLAARDLTHNEIVACSLRKRMRGYSPLLEVQKDSNRRPTYFCGSNPHYVASLFTLREIAEIEASDPIEETGADELGALHQ